LVLNPSVYGIRRPAHPILSFSAAGYHASTGLLPQLEKSSKWKEAFHNGQALVFVRKDAMPDARSTAKAEPRRDGAQAGR
jgi:hypothetical protein